MFNIRPGKATDIPNICMVHKQAFGQEQGEEIVELVCGLLADATAQPLLSLVAEVDDRKPDTFCLHPCTSVQVGEKISMSAPGFLHHWRCCRPIKVVV